MQASSQEAEGHIGRFGVVLANVLRNEGGVEIKRCCTLETQSRKADVLFVFDGVKFDVHWLLL